MPNVWSEAINRRRNNTMAQRENKWKEKQYELYAENSKIAQHGSHQKKGEPGAQEQ